MQSEEEYYDVIIFGGGIAGLTVAHQLAKRKFKILVVEKNSTFGGMARSAINSDGVPSEVSLRWLIPLYNNLFRLLHEIPFDSSKSVLHNLVDEEILSYNVHDKYDRYALYNYVSYRDYIVISYFVLKYLAADKRKKKYFEIEPYFKKYLSKNGQQFLINYIGNALGLHPNDVSLGHIVNYYFLYINDGQKYIRGQQDNINVDINSTLYMFNNLISNAWIDPWITYLKSQNVEFINNCELSKFIYHTNDIVSAEIIYNGSAKIVKANEYIMAINPYNSVDIFRNSGLNKLDNLFNSLTKNTTSNEISFVIGIKKDIKYPSKYSIFNFSKSSFRLFIASQDKFFKNKIKFRTLWSGIIIDFKKKGLLFNKNAESLTKEQLRQEIIHQILGSKGFQKMIYDYNGFYINKKDIEYFNLWHEWKFIDGKQALEPKKWANNLYNEQFKPSQSTSFSNLFLAGAHTKTGFKTWSMESAAESGNIVANLLLNKYNKKNIYHYKFQEPAILGPLKIIDNFFYHLRLPNVLDILLILLIIFIIFKLWKNNNK